MVRPMLKPLVCLLLAIAAQPAWAQTARSLDQVPSLLKTPESKGVFAQQIEGKAAPDALGVHLPPALSAQGIATLLVPADDKTPLNTVGAKPLPGQSGIYVAIVCTGGAVYLGEIEANEGTAPHLIAKPAKVDGMVNWRDTELPSAPDALDEAKGDTIRPDSFDGFDLAPYRISPDQRAFGIRGTWSDSYSAGMGSYSALYLFAVVDGALRHILAVPMSSYTDIAGDRHKDGTRSHEISQGANVLIVSTHSTNGHFDLLLKSRTGHWHRLFRWSVGAGGYEPAGK